MKLPDFDHIDAITIFATGIGKAVSFLGSSGACWYIANALPEEQSLIKAASALTGWGLAIACIYTLVRAVRVLFAKLEDKDKIISELHETALTKAENHREKMLVELQAINRNSSRHSGPTDH